MIISHAHRFIFLAVPKTGSQSVRAALRPHLGPDDQEQASWGTKLRLPVPELAEVGHGHLTADEVRPHLDPAVWRSYFKFAFVRNPWSRYLSCAFFMNRERPLFRARPRALLRLLLENERLMEDPWFRPQHRFLGGDVAGTEMDFVGRFESLAEDLERVRRRVGLPPLELLHLNASERLPAEAYHDRELREEVARRYERDIRIFGYRFDRSGTIQR